PISKSVRKVRRWAGTTNGSAYPSAAYAIGRSRAKNVPSSLRSSTRSPPPAGSKNLPMVSAPRPEQCAHAPAARAPSASRSARSTPDPAARAPRTAGSLHADQDVVVVLAADHFVRIGVGDGFLLGEAQRELHPVGHRAAQGDGGQTAGHGAGPFVELQRVLIDALGGLGALGLVLLVLGVERGQCLVPFGGSALDSGVECFVLFGAGGGVGLGGAHSLHLLQLH